MFLDEYDDQNHAADQIGYILYGKGKCSRWVEFRAGFLEGLEAYDTGTWVQAMSVGPRATGNNLSAVWATRRN